MADGKRNNNHFDELLSFLLFFFLVLVTRGRLDLPTPFYGLDVHILHEH